MALTVDEGDELISAGITDGKSQVIVFTKKGLCIMFSEKDIRPMGRTARGVRGINLSSDDSVVSVEVFPEERQSDKDHVLLVTSGGLWKKNRIYRL